MPTVSLLGHKDIENHLCLLLQIGWLLIDHLDLSSEIEAMIQFFCVVISLEVIVLSHNGWLFLATHDASILNRTCIYVCPWKPSLQSDLCQVSAGLQT